MSFNAGKKYNCNLIGNRKTAQFPKAVLVNKCFAIFKKYINFI